MSNKGCGTCKDRKIRCDRTVPVCQRCLRANRKCKGYSIKLSWPKDTDGKRAVVASSSLTKQKVGSRTPHPGVTVSASAWDIEMYYYISSLGLDDRQQFLPPVIPARISWNPLHLNLHNRNLLQYFETVASNSVAILGFDATKIRDILLRLALLDSSSTSKAVMQSLLAVSSLHRFGPGSTAVNLKESALRTLVESLASGIDTQGALQHIAAGMLLCTFETQEATMTSGQWIWYLFGVKDVIAASKLLETSLLDSSFTALLLWVQYHDTLSSFSLLHWRRYAPVEDAYLKDIGERLIPGDVPLSHEILSLLLEGTDYKLLRSASEQNYNEYRAHVISLQEKLLSIPIPEISIESFPIKPGTPLADISDAELFRLATLIYLGRTADSCGQDDGSQWIDMGFRILGQLDAYPRPFPLFIFGLEARRDEQRIALFELINKTEEKMPMRSLTFIRLMIQSIWVQDDLAQRELKYRDRLSIILSSNETLPTFV